MTDRLQEARDLIAAMNTDKPWTFGDTEKALSLLEWAVPEIERLRVNGLRPTLVSLDDYYLGLEEEAKLERLRVELRQAGAR